MDLARKFSRAADQRFTTAEFLAANGFHLDSIYLGGYAVECALKAPILSRTAKAKRLEAIERLTHGQKVHNFEHLKNALKKRGCEMPLDVAAALREVAFWSTDLRYEVGRKTFQEARVILDAVFVIMEWGKQSQ